VIFVLKTALEVEKPLVRAFEYEVQMLPLMVAASPFMLIALMKVPGVGVGVL